MLEPHFLCQRLEMDARGHLLLFPLEVDLFAEMKWDNMTVTNVGCVTDSHTESHGAIGVSEPECQRGDGRGLSLALEL